MYYGLHPVSTSGDCLQVGGFIISVLALSAEHQGFNPFQIKPKTLKLVFAASPLSAQHLGVRAKTGWPRVRIMYVIKVACLPADCCFCEPAC